MTVLSQIEKIRELEIVLEELKAKKKRSTLKSKSSSKKRDGSKSPGGRKSNTIEAPSMMNQSRRSNSDLYNIF